MLILSYWLIFSYWITLVDGYFALEFIETNDGWIHVALVYSGPNDGQGISVYHVVLCGPRVYLCFFVIPSSTVSYCLIDLNVSLNSDKGVRQRLTLPNTLRQQKHLLVC